MNRQQRRALERSAAKTPVPDEFDRDHFATVFADHPLTAANMIRYILNNIDEPRYGCSAPVAFMQMYQYAMTQAIADLSHVFEERRRGDPQVWAMYAEALRSLLAVFAATCLRPVQEPMSGPDRKQALMRWAAGVNDPAVKTVAELYAMLPEDQSPVQAFYVGGIGAAEQVPGMPEQQQKPG